MVRSSEYLDAVVAALKGIDVEVVQDLIGLKVEDLRSVGSGGKIAFVRGRL